MFGWSHFHFCLPSTASLSNTRFDPFFPGDWLPWRQTDNEIEPIQTDYNWSKSAFKNKIDRLTCPGRAPHFYRHPSPGPPPPHFGSCVGVGQVGVVLRNALPIIAHQIASGVFWQTAPSLFCHTGPPHPTTPHRQLIIRLMMMMFSTLEFDSRLPLLLLLLDYRHHPTDRLADQPAQAHPNGAMQQRVGFCTKFRAAEPMLKSGRKSAVIIHCVSNSRPGQIHSCVHHSAHALLIWTTHGKHLPVTLSASSFVLLSIVSVCVRVRAFRDSIGSICFIWNRPFVLSIRVQIIFDPNSRIRRLTSLCGGVFYPSKSSSFLFFFSTPVNFISRIQGN